MVSNHNHLKLLASLNANDPLLSNDRKRKLIYADICELKMPYSVCDSKPHTKRQSRSGIIK